MVDSIPGLTIGQGNHKGWPLRLCNNPVSRLGYIRKRLKRITEIVLF